MDMTISIPDDVAARLQKRAAVSGQSLPVYTAKLVADTVTKPTIDEILAPVREDFAASGMSEEETTDFLRGQLEAHRLHMAPASGR
jgi:hypothetical protein